MTAKQIERAAYVAAHRILAANTAMTEFACPGTRRSRTIDKIASLIRETFESHNPIVEESLLFAASRRETGPQLVPRRPAGTVRPLDRRVVSRSVTPEAS